MTSSKQSEKSELERLCLPRELKPPFVKEPPFDRALIESWKLQPACVPLDDADVHSNFPPTLMLPAFQLVIMELPGFVCLSRPKNNGRSHEIQQRRTDRGNERAFVIFRKEKKKKKKLILVITSDECSMRLKKLNQVC